MPFFISGRWIVPSLLVPLMVASGCEGKIDGGPVPAMATGCDLNAGPCVVDTRWGPLRVDLGARPLRALRPQRVLLDFAMDNPPPVALALHGVGMEMGPHSVRAARVDDRRLAAEIVAPVCVTGEMSWRLEIQLTQGDRRENAYLYLLADQAASAAAAASPR